MEIIDLKDIIYWILMLFVTIVGWFLNRTISKIELTQSEHDKRISKVETEVAVIGKSVDNNFNTLSGSIDGLQHQLSEIKALLIENIKDNNKKI